MTELHRCENCVFFLPVNILTAWCADFLGFDNAYIVVCTVFYAYNI